MSLLRTGLPFRLRLQPSVRKASGNPRRLFSFDSRIQKWRIPGSPQHQSATPLSHTSNTTWRLSALFRGRVAKVRWNSNVGRPSPDPTPNLGSPSSLTLSQRLKQLSREYGWAALGVYLGLSVLDFPFCFLAVRMLGPERVGHWEHKVLEAIRSVIEIPLPGLMKKHDEPVATENGASGNSTASKLVGLCLYFR
jgi:hypothetical protein